MRDDMIANSEQLDKAAETGYLVTGNGYETYNMWYSECKKSDRPFVVVRMARTRGDVEMDLIGNNFKLTEEGVAAVCEKLAEMKLAFSVGDVFSYVSHVPIDKVKEVAGMFMECASKHRKARGGAGRK